MKRYKMKKRWNRKNYRKGLKTNGRNLNSPAIMRGGTRL